MGDWMDGIEGKDDGGDVLVGIEVVVVGRLEDDWEDFDSFRVGVVRICAGNDRV